MPHFLKFCHNNAGRKCMGTCVFFKSILKALRPLEAFWKPLEGLLKAFGRPFEGLLKALKAFRSIFKNKPLWHTLYHGPHFYINPAYRINTAIPHFYSTALPHTARNFCYCAQLCDCMLPLSLSFQFCSTASLDHRHAVREEHPRHRLGAAQEELCQVQMAGECSLSFSARDVFFFCFQVTFTSPTPPPPQLPLLGGQRCFTFEFARQCFQSNLFSFGVFSFFTLFDSHFTSLFVGENLGEREEKLRFLIFYSCQLQNKIFLAS